jgi:hypothetical protein
MKRSTTSQVLNLSPRNRQGERSSQAVAARDGHYFPDLLIACRRLHSSRLADGLRQVFGFIHVREQLGAAEVIRDLDEAIQ